jgi:HEAT repeat protein
VNDPVRALLLTLLPALAGVAVLLVVLLVAVRATGELLGRRAERRRDERRALILTAALGEPDQAAPAMAELRARQGRAWRQVEQQVFTMLPKVKGDSHTTLVALLQGRGAARRAHRYASSRSMVRRSRAAYRLGALGDREALGALIALLADEHFLVRRTAVRALGQLRDPVAVTPLLDAVTDDPALVRDVVAALQRIGADAAPHLRRDLEEVLEHRLPGRRGALVATVLGLHGDIASVRALTRALASGHESSLRAAAAEALGEIGVPVAVPALVDALEHPDAEVRVQAAVALGKVSDATALDGLLSVLDTGPHVVDRAVAEALVRLGPPGLGALADHPSPYAAEALALHLTKAHA